MLAMKMGEDGGTHKKRNDKPDPLHLGSNILLGHFQTSEHPSCESFMP